MQTFLLKLKLIFLPFLLVSVSVILAYTLFNFLFIQTEIISINQSVFELWVPAVLSWISITILLRQKLNLLKNNKPNFKSHIVKLNQFKVLMEYILKA